MTIHSLFLVQRTERPITVDGQPLRTRLQHRHGNAHHLGDFTVEEARLSSSFPSTH